MRKSGVDSFGSGQKKKLPSSSENGNEPLGSREWGEFLVWLGNYQFIMKNSLGEFCVFEQSW
jgi:hypothetical protein